MFIILIPAYVYLNEYTCLPLVPYSFIFIAIFICIVCVMFSIYTHVFVCLPLFRNLIDTCVTVSIDVIILLLMDSLSPHVIIL